MLTTQKYVLWLDLETTGLVPEKTVILEVGAKIVDTKFNIISEFNKVVQYDPLPDMDAWCFVTHTKSGLLKEVLGDNSVPLKFVELAICSWLNNHFTDNKVELSNDNISYEGQIILTGTGIHFDRRYIRYHMPKLNELLHHRMIDITAAYYFNKMFTNKQLPEKTSSKDLGHRAMSDIDNSIALAKAMSE